MDDLPASDATIDLTTNRYALSLYRRRRLKDELRGTPGSARNGLRIVELSGMDSRSDLGRQLEQQVFDLFFGHRAPHTPDLMASEYGPYEDRSIFLLAIEEGTLEVLGVIRLLPGFPNKMFTDLNLDPDSESLSSYGLRSANIWELATIAISPIVGLGVDRSDIATALYRAMLRKSIEQNITDWVAIFDIHVLPTLDYIGVHFERFAGIDNIDYLGSDAQPSYLSVSAIRDAMVKRHKSADPIVRRQIEAILDGSQQVPELEELTPKHPLSNTA